MLLPLSSLCLCLSLRPTAFFCSSHPQNKHTNTNTQTTQHISHSFSLFRFESVSFFFFFSQSHFLSFSVNAFQSHPNNNNTNTTVTSLFHSLFMSAPAFFSSFCLLPFLWFFFHSLALLSLPLSFVFSSAPFSPLSAPPVSTVLMIGEACVESRFSVLSANCRFSFRLICFCVPRFFPLPSVFLPYSYVSFRSSGSVRSLFSFSHFFFSYVVVRSLLLKNICFCLRPLCVASRPLSPSSLSRSFLPPQFFCFVAHEKKNSRACALYRVFSFLRRLFRLNAHTSRRHVSSFSHSIFSVTLTLCCCHFSLIACVFL